MYILRLYSRYYLGQTLIVQKMDKGAVFVELSFKNLTGINFHEYACSRYKHEYMIFICNRAYN